MSDTYPDDLKHREWEDEMFGKGPGDPDGLILYPGESPDLKVLELDDGQALINLLLSTPTKPKKTKTNQKGNDKETKL